jgi:ABC-type long-subunit fatty acid transport system fused permease/ATPase subunit
MFSCFFPNPKFFFPAAVLWTALMRDEPLDIIEAEVMLRQQ